MWISRLFLFQKAALAGAMVLLVSGIAAGAAEEPVSIAVENPKPKVEESAIESIRSKLFRPYRPSTLFSDPVAAKPKFVAPAPPVSEGGTRRTDELLDRQKNWIFASPTDEPVKSDATEKALGVDGLMFDESRSKGVVNRFLTDSRQAEPSAAESEYENAFVPIFGLGNGKEKEVGFQNMEIHSDPRIDPRLRNFNTQGVNKPLDVWRAEQGAHVQRLREEKETRMKDFEGLFGSKKKDTAQNGGMTLFGEKEGLGSKPTSSTLNGSGQFNGLGFSSKELLQTAPRSSPGIQATPNPDINVRVFGASAEKAVAPEPERVRQPAVLPFPKRKF